MRKNDVNEYQFDLFQPYIIYRSKVWRVMYLLLFVLLFISGLSEKGNEWLYIVLFLILALLIIKDIRSKNKIIQIDIQGITTDETKLIEWSEIQACFYSSGIGKNPRQWLNVKLANGNDLRIVLNGYAYNGKKIAAAIDFYSGRKTFGRTKQDDINELKVILVSFLVIIILSILIILLSSVIN